MPTSPPKERAIKRSSHLHLFSICFSWLKNFLCSVFAFTNICTNWYYLMSWWPSSLVTTPVKYESWHHHLFLPFLYLLSFYFPSLADWEKNRIWGKRQGKSSENEMRGKCKIRRLWFHEFVIVFPFVQDRKVQLFVLKSFDISREKFLVEREIDEQRDWSKNITKN